MPSPLVAASASAKGGDHAKALTEIQEYLAPFGKQAQVSVEAVQAATLAVRLCNELSLSCMRDAAVPTQLDAAYAYLKWALKAPHASPALRAVTFNNAGIYYARTGQPQAALRCLERVGRQGGLVVEDDVSVHVKLNMTTVLADLGRHAEALEMAQEAVRMLTHAERVGKATDSSLLSAAYHNLGVQQERLGASKSKSKGHVRSYRAAMLQARRSGPNPMQAFMEQAYTHARQRAVQPRPPLDGSPPLGAAGKSDANNSKGSLPPVGPRASASSAKLGGGSTPKYGSLVPRARSSQAESRRRAEQQRKQQAPYVSLDDVYSGTVPAAAVPVGAVGGVAPALTPPPGADYGAGKRHAPRSAGTARVTASAASPASG